MATKQVCRKIDIVGRIIVYTHLFIPTANKLCWGGGMYRKHHVRQSVCLSKCLASATLLNNRTNTDETFYSCVIRPENVHEGGQSQSISREIISSAGGVCVGGGIIL